MPIIPPANAKMNSTDLESKKTSMTQRIVKSVALLTALTATCCLIGNYERISEIKTAMQSHRKTLYNSGPLRMRQNLVWLLAYPFAGARATIKIVQTVSNKSCATNYGTEYMTNWDDSVKMTYSSAPVYTNTPNGPFKQHLQMDLPESDILVRTYCSGYCMEDGSENACSLGDYAEYLVKGAPFQKACASATSFKAEGKEVSNTVYDANRVKKAIILIRNPLEILISRYTDSYKSSYLKLNGEGLTEWCARYNAQNGTRTLLYHWYFERTKAAAHGTICHGEFYRMVMWYNQAFKIMSVVGNDVMVMRFEDYETKIEKAVDRIFNYLRLEKMENYEIPFKREHSAAYQWDKWYTPDQVKHIRNFFDSVADDRTRYEFDRYWPV